MRSFFPDLTVFSTLVYFGYGQRRNPAAHKRLVMIGTIALLDAAFARWPLAIANQHHMDDFACFFLVLLIGAYDLFCNRKLHWATASGGALLVLAKYPIRSLLYAYLPGHRAAHYMQAIGRHLL